MAQLAIRGHATRGREVIELLEMLGGVNCFHFTGDSYIGFYYIDDDDEFIKNRIYAHLDANTKLFDIEDFMSKFPYKVGDKVLVKGYESPVDILEMIWNGSEIEYRINIEDDWLTSDELQHYKEETMEEVLNYCKTGKITTVIFQEQNYEDKVELDLGDNFEIKVEDGKTYIVKKKPQYPKTYEECCEILNVECDFLIDIDIDEVFTHLIRLKRCRDAYLKIAGEQMGLGKPWKPYWGGFSEDSYPTITKCNDRIVKTSIYTHDCIFAFPTEEMRDAFFENFKNLIEQCKELL